MARRAMVEAPGLILSSKGRLRTEMPAWEKVFNQQQIADVSEYVFNTFINPWISVYIIVL